MKNLNIIIKGAYLHRRLSENFLREFKRQITPQILEKFNFLNNRKKLKFMMFDTFELYDMIEDGYIYYPILYEYNGDEGFIWVTWPALSEDGEYIGLASNNIPDFVKFEVCRKVPERIDRYVRSLEIHMPMSKVMPIREGAAYSVSQPFMYRLAEQIYPTLSETLGIKDLNNSGYKIVITGNSHLGQNVFKDDKYSYTKLKLFDKSGIAIALWIRWQSLIPGKKYIEIDEPLIPAASIRFEILSSVPKSILEQADDDYDEENFIDTIKRKFVPDFSTRKKKKGKYHFQYSVDCSSFPFCQIQIVFNEKMHKDTENDLDVFYWTFLQNRNSAQENKIIKRYIDDFSEVERVNDNTLKLNTNFGNCKPNTVHEFLRALDKSFFDIEKVIVN